MARSGLYKSDIKQARDVLLAQGKNPSVDAVRVALGNTGSKTTIHKYLKELEVDEIGLAQRGAGLSAALQDLTQKLAAQLQSEAEVQIAQMQAQVLEKEQQHARAEASWQQENLALVTQLQETAFNLQQEQAAHQQVRQAWQDEKIARHTLEQQVYDLQERLAENAAHRASLEEKHQHARQALEHYRNSVKEQREQDQRRHEQQLQHLQAEMRQLQQTQIVKQDEMTRLHQDGARLQAGVLHAQQALHEQQARNQQLEGKLALLPIVEQQVKNLQLQLFESVEQKQACQSQLEGALVKVENLAAQSHALELSLASAEAKLQAQQGMHEQLRQLRQFWEKPTPGDKLAPEADS